jgi:hypothetical protein
VVFFKSYNFMKKPFNSHNLTYFVLTGIGLEKINRGGTHSMCSYVDYAGVFGSPGATVRYVTTRDDKGRDKGKYFTWSESHRRFVVREGEQDINGITQYEFLKNAPECEGSPNGTYTPDGSQTGVVYREMNTAKDAEVALEADQSRIKAQASALELDITVLAEVAAHIGVFAGKEDPSGLIMRVRVVDWAGKNPNDYFAVLNSGDREVRAVVRKAVADGILTVKGSLILWENTAVGSDENAAVSKLMSDPAMYSALKEKIDFKSVTPVKRPGRPKKNEKIISTTND